MRLNRRVPVGTHGGVRGRLSIYESLLLDYLLLCGPEFWPPFPDCIVKKPVGLNVETDLQRVRR